MADGLTNADIAEQAGHRRRTVKTHVSSIIAKLGVRRARGHPQAIRRGLVSTHRGRRVSGRPGRATSSTFG